MAGVRLLPFSVASRLHYLFNDSGKGRGAPYISSAGSILTLGGRFCATVHIDYHELYINNTIRLRGYCRIWLWRQYQLADATDPIFC